MTTKSTKQSTLLPQDIRDELVAASRIRDPLLRQITVQQATERAQQRYPQYFQSFNQPEKSK